MDVDDGMVVCRFVLVEEPDLSGIPVFTQAVYGSYPVSITAASSVQGGRSSLENEPAGWNTLKTSAPTAFNL